MEPGEQQQQWQQRQACLEHGGAAVSHRWAAPAPPPEPPHSHSRPVLSQDFKADHASPDIDFGSIHVWPGLWKCLDCQALLSVDFVKRYIQQHIKGAACAASAYSSSPRRRQPVFRRARELLISCPHRPPSPPRASPCC